MGMNKLERSISLKSVKCFGSEGRRQGNGEIPPREGLLENVTLKFDLVKEYEIVSKGQTREESSNNSGADPAIISTEAGKKM